MWKTVGAVFLIAVNLAAFVMMGVDKRRAVRGEYRVPERTLLTISACFGAPGALIGMNVFHHKTKKTLFRIGVPMMLVIQIILLGIGIYKLLVK